MRTIRKEVEEYLEYCEKVRGMSGATMRMKRNILYRFAETVGVRRISRLRNRDLDKWVEGELARGISARTMNMYITAVMAMMRYFGTESGVCREGAKEAGSICVSRYVQDD